MLDKDLRTELISLERKILMLVNETKKAKEEIAYLRHQNLELKDELKKKRDQIGSFQNTAKISKIVDSMVENEDDTTELKQVINDYIKEIDKCIAHLSQ